MSTTHKLEELARWHDEQAGEYERRVGVSCGLHRLHAQAIRAAIPDCECGELARTMVNTHGSFAIDTVSDRVRVGTIHLAQGGYRHRVVAESGTMPAAVSEAKATP